MAIEDKKYTAIHDKTGGDKVKLKDEFDAGYLTRVSSKPDKEPALAALVYQIGLIQEELDYLRTEISTNKDKSTFPGLGTSGSTCLAGNTTVISSGQASAITANTAKTGISTSQASAITANTAKVSLVGGTGTALSFGEMIITPPAKGSKNPTYSIVMTATKGVGSKATTKSVTLPLT